MNVGVFTDIFISFFIVYRDHYMKGSTDVYPSTLKFFFLQLIYFRVIMSYFINNIYDISMSPYLENLLNFQLT